MFGCQASRGEMWVAYTVCSCMVQRSAHLEIGQIVLLLPVRLPPAAPVSRLVPALLQGRPAASARDRALQLPAAQAAWLHGGSVASCQEK